MNLMAFQLKERTLFYKKCENDLWIAAKSSGIAHAVLSIYNLSLKSQEHLLNGGEIRIWSKHSLAYYHKSEYRRLVVKRRELYRAIIEKSDGGIFTMPLLFEYKPAKLKFQEARPWNSFSTGWTKLRTNKSYSALNIVYEEKAEVSLALRKFILRLTAEFPVKSLGKIEPLDQVNISFYVGEPTVNRLINYKELSRQLSKLCKEENLYWSLEILNQKVGLVRLVISIDKSRKTMWLVPSIREDYRLQNIDFRQ